MWPQGSRSLYSKIKQVENEKQTLLLLDIVNLEVYLIV